MTVPSWFSLITWSTPVAVEVLRASRHLLPPRSGVYAFTNYAGPLAQNTGVLYVGKATSLFERVQSYLVDPEEVLLTSTRSGTPRMNTSLRHAGKVGLLVEIQQKARGTAPSGIWVRWFETVSPENLEGLLLPYLRPAFNTQGIT